MQIVNENLPSFLYCVSNGNSPIDFTNIFHHFLETMKYKIPHSFLDKFTEVAGRNYAADGKHLETLAYLLGHETATGDVIATSLVFPDQVGHLSQVDDRGNTYMF